MPNKQNQWIYRKPSAPTGNYDFILPFILGPMAIVYGGIVSAGISGGFSALTFMCTRNSALARKAFTAGMVTFPALALGAYIVDGYETRNMRIARLQSNMDHSVAKQDYSGLNYAVRDLYAMGVTPNLNAKTRETIHALCEERQAESDELCASDYGVDEAEKALNACKGFLALYDRLLAKNSVNTVSPAGDKPKPRF